MYRLDSTLIMERLDRAYASREWLDEFPSTVLHNFPIINSDHAPIMLQTSPSLVKPNRPYQLESWCLQHPDVITIIHEIWLIHVEGSAMYSLVRKMDMLRTRLKTWCLDKRLFWGVNWRKFFNELRTQGNQVQNITHGNALVHRHRVLLDEASLAMHYWQQRIKDRHLQLGDIPSKILFNRLRQKKQQNFVYMLRDSAGEWSDNPHVISLMIQSYFKDIYRVVDASPLSNTQHGTAIDLVLRELHLPQLSGPDSQALLAPITSLEIRTAMFEMANDKSPGLDGMPAEFFKLH